MSHERHEAPPIPAPESSVVIRPAPDGPAARTDQRSYLASMFRFHRLHTSHGAVVGAEQDTGRVVGHPDAAENATWPVALATSIQQPHLGLLVALSPEPLAIRLEADSMSACALSSHVEWSVADHRPRHLRHPQSLAYISAILPMLGGRADLVSNRDESGAWEAFDAVEIQSADLSDGAVATLAAYAELFTSELRADDVIRWLERHGRRDLPAITDARPVLRLLTSDDLAAVAAFLLRRDDLSYGGVPTEETAHWYAAFEELRAWWPSRALPQTALIDEGFDHAAKLFGNWRHDPSIEGLVNLYARRAVEPRRTFCVVATARNEGIYLLEWIAHYRALGAAHIFLTTNDNNDQSDLLLARLAERGIITWITNRGGARVDGQIKAYNHALSLAPGVLDYRWCLIVDLDELLILDQTRHASLAALLRAREQQGASAVAFAWKMYTSGGERAFRSDPLLSRFLHKETNDNRQIKTAFQPRYYMGSWPHDPIPAPRAPYVFLNAAGKLHHWRGREELPSEGEPTFTDAWVNHYFYKSVDEWIWKSSRNRGGYELRHDLAFEPTTLDALLRWFAKEACDEDGSALPMLPALEEELSRLRSLPGIAEAEAAVTARFAVLLAGLKQRAVAAVEQDESLTPERRVAYLDLLVSPPAR